MKRRNAAREIGIYTALVVSLGSVCLAGMLFKGVIWNVDGLMQHYPFMKVIGDWLRDALSGKFHMFDFSLGFGADVLASLNYYGLGDPLLMLIALIAGSSEWGMAALILIRMYLAGAACMLLGKKYGYSERQCAAAGAIYALSTGLLSGAATRQVLFLNAYIHFPLMLAGLEDVFERRKTGWLSAAVWLSALSGFYMLYCESVLLLVCALVRYFTRNSEKSAGDFFAATGRAIGQYLLGLGFAAVVFVPVVLGFLDGQRLSNTFDGNRVNLMYALKSYLTLPLTLFTDHGTGAGQPMLVLGFIGLVPMILNRKEKSARAFAILGFLSILTPVTGWVLNGFSYETTRWSFALSLLAAMLSVRGVEYAMKLTKKKATLICSLPAAYCAVLLIPNFSGVRKLIPCAMLLLIGASRLAVGLCASGKRWVRAGKVLMVCVCAVQIVFNCWDVWQNRSDEMMPFGESEALYEKNALNDLSEFPRTDVSLTEIAPLLNASAWSNTASTGVYNSTISGRVFRFMREVGNSGLIQMNAVCGLDSRAALETVWSVGRYLGDSAPYGFFQTEDGTYENRYALPIGYAYTDSISTETYEALSPLEKQWALLQCAVLENAEDGSVSQSLFNVPIERIEWEHVEVNGETMEVGEDACIRLTFSAPADCELYVTIQDFEYHGSEIALGNYVTFTSGAGYSQINLMPSNFELTIADREAIIVHLGYDENARTTAEIRFAKTGEYRMGALTLTAQPMADYETYVTKLQEHGLEDVSVENDRVSGTIRLETDGTVVYAIPYSAGWTATVDGERVQTTCSAGCMLAVPVTAGEHKIVIRYVTPGLPVGGAVTCATAVLVGFLCIIKKRRLSKAS